MMDDTRPSKADMEHATELLRYQQRGLSEVRQYILDQFNCMLHDASVVYSRRCDVFVVTIFYPQDKDIMAAEKSGLKTQIETAVLAALEKVGRGEQSALKVEFTFSSYETMRRDYGNYDHYFR